MDEYTTGIAPTSIATTRATEPAVAAAITSAEGNPDAPLSIRVDSGGFTLAQTLLLIGGAVALGYAATRWLARA